MKLESVKANVFFWGTSSKVLPLRFPTFNRLFTLLTAAVVIAWAGYANAAPIVLDFTGLNGTSNEEPLNYYSGGYGSLGTGPGPNYGVTFSSNAVACNGNSISCANVAEFPSSNALVFTSGTGAIMDVSGGFNTGFAFYYSAPYSTIPASVNVYSGLDGTGTLLASLSLPATPNNGNAGCDGRSFCPFEPLGVSFSGTAESVNFGGSILYVVFSDITLNSNTPGASVPEPSTMLLLGSGLIGLLVFRKQLVKVVG